jgi:uncharacterized protein YyaL (SSP411 family)
MTPGPSPAWRDWSTEAFAAAHRGAMPVLLLVGARWSDACRRLEREVLADPAVVDVIASRFVALRVDADRRPDIADRYGLSPAGPTPAWPTLLCLTPDGEVLSGGTTIEASRLARVLARVAETFAAQREDIERRAREARRARRLAVDEGAVSKHGVDDNAPASAAAYLGLAFDETWAGFGDGAKLPESSAVAFALTHGVRTGDPRLRDIAVRTLDRLGWSDLSDARTGAFHRACATREWTDPDSARLLGVQADLAGLFLDAATILDEDAYAERARAALTWVAESLADEGGGFFESQWSEEDEARRPEPEAGWREPEDGSREPGLDRILVASSNARMVRTLLRAAEVLQAPRFGELAMATIERLVPLLYSSGAGVAHYLEYGAGLPAAGSGADTARAGAPAPRVRGLLVDQVEMSAALIDLTQASGNRVYLELAEELMRSCLRKLWSPAHGGFLDRLRSPSGGGDIGRMADPLVPFATNCHAARVLARLARETGHDELRVSAVDTLAVLSPAAAEQGIHAADYALAVVDVTASVEA